MGFETRLKLIKFGHRSKLIPQWEKLPKYFNPNFTFPSQLRLKGKDFLENIDPKIIFLRRRIFYLVLWTRIHLCPLRFNFFFFPFPFLRVLRGLRGPRTRINNKIYFH